MTFFFVPQVAVVAFSDNAETPYGGPTTSTCYSNQLAMATSETKIYLGEFVSNIRANGGTMYQRALRKAFGFFTDSAAPRNDSGQRSMCLLLFVV